MTVLIRTFVISESDGNHNSRVTLRLTINFYFGLVLRKLVFSFEGSFNLRLTFVC